MKTAHRFLPFVQALLLSATLPACAEESPEDPQKTETGSAAKREDEAGRTSATKPEAPAATAKADASPSAPREEAVADPDPAVDAGGAAGAAGSAATTGAGGAIAAAGAAGAAGGPFSSGPIVPPELPASFS